MIFYCVMYGSEESVKLLIEYGADVHVCTEDNRTPLHEVRIPNVIPLLVKEGLSVDAKDNYGFTPFMCLIFDKELIIELLRYKPKLDACERRKLKEKYPDLHSRWIRGKWSILKPCVKLLALHKRAVITANHPLRKLARSEFEV